MLDEKQKILNDNDFLNERKNARIVSKYEKSKRGLFILSILLSLLIIGVLYILLPVSNVKDIEVIDNVYIKDEDIVEMSEVSTSSKYVFLNPKTVENKIKENVLIDTCVVEKLDDLTIRISVTEKKIVGYSFEDNQNVLIMADDSRIILDKKNLYLINYVPLLEGFDKDSIKLIEKNLNDVDYKMINEISEIHYYPELKFQDHEIIMRDGNYIFTSVYGLNLLNRYYDMASSLASDKHNCYYVEDISGNAYVSACPWEEVVEDNIEETKQDSEE